MSQTERGRRLWELNAPRAEIAPDGGATLELPEIDFYKNGRRASTATARTASVREGTESMRLEGDVVITGHEEKVVVRTTRLDYDGADRRFRTKERVVIERPGARLIGRGMEGDASLSEITIYKQETVVRD